VAGDIAFLRTAWFQTPHSGDNWSREAVVREMAKAIKFEGMTRQQVIQLLGMPGYTDEDYALGEGLRGRTDLYRVSSEGKAYHLWYDSRDDKASSIDFEDCHADQWQKYSHAPAVSLKVLNATILKKDAARVDSIISIADLAKTLGRAGQSSVSEGRAGGREWIYYQEVWRIEGTAHRFLVVNDHYPGRLPTHKP
jgi:hypothetical protein